MNGDYPRAGINITTRKLQVVEIAKESGNYRIVRLDEAYFSQPINFETQKEIIIGAQIQSSFDEIQIRRPLKSKIVSFTLPPELFSTVQLPQPVGLLHHDLLEELRWELSLIFPYLPVNNMAVSYFNIDKNMMVTKNTVCISALERKYLRLLKSFCSRNNILFGKIDSAFSAAAGVIEEGHSYLKDELILSIYISHTYCVVTFLINNKPVYIRLAAINNFEELINFITDEIEDSGIKNIRKGLISRTHISGEDVRQEIVDRLNSLTGLESEMFNPFSKINFDQEVRNSLIFENNFNSYAAAAGIALRTA